MDPKRSLRRTGGLAISLASFWLVSLGTPAAGEESWLTRHWLWSRAYVIPEETTSEQSGYFSIVEGHNGHLYVGTAKYGHNAFLVDFDPQAETMKVVVDAHQEIGETAQGFAAQAKIHTRNNVGRSGKIYFGTKQGYPRDGESRSDYRGGYPMVYDPATGQTRVYEIPIPGQGIISVTPDEARGVAYLSTCSDERPIESTHFMRLDLETGRYRDLLDCRHMYAFIVVDALGRAYHPILGGNIARYDPRTDQLDQLTQSIDGQPPRDASRLADPKSHPLNWDISPDRQTLYAVAMSGNQLFSYDLTGTGKTLPGRSLGPLVPGAEKTDCRAMCVAPNGTVWAGVAATFAGRGQFLHLVSYRPGDGGSTDQGPIDHGPIAIGNPDYTALVDEAGKPRPHHHGVYRLPDGTLLPRYVIMGICAARDDTIYLTTLYPFTVHRIRVPKVAGVVTAYYHNAHADVILSRLLETDALNGTGQRASLELASIFTDQVPANDTSRSLAAAYDVPIRETVGAAVAVGRTVAGQPTIADGVLLVAEHGDYPHSATGQKVFPKRRLFGEIVKAFERAGRVAPVFSDKHLADNWADAKWVYDTARQHRIPMMAGSSLPVLWRYPPTDVPRGAKLKQIVALSYHSLDAYGFHAVEMVQSLVERRAGGETGVARVRCITGDEVWLAESQGVYDRKLLDAALARLQVQPLPAGKRVEDLAKSPVLFVIDYNDGLRACIFTLNGAVLEWAAAWSNEAGEIDSTLFSTQEARPYNHFTYLLMGIERMMHTGKPTWPVERTLLSSGILDAALISKRDGGDGLETPWLNVTYQTTWNWQQPPPPPPGRPSQEK